MHFQERYLSYASSVLSITKTTPAKLYAIINGSYNGHAIVMLTIPITHRACVKTYGTYIIPHNVKQLFFNYGIVILTCNGVV